MTDQPQKGAPARNAGRSLLGALVADPERFAADVWSRCPLHCPAAALPGTARALFSAEAVDELVSTRGLRTPFLRMARNGATLAERDFTAPGGAGATIADQLSDDKLLQQFAGGATMVLQGLHRTWEPLIAFSQGLAGELGHPVQVNGYVTPAQSRGFDDHYDVHDVFVLQVAGTKRWRVRPPVHPSPLRDQPWTDHREAIARAAQTTPELEVELAPGDTLYLPRGWLHSATALGEVSTHLTMGVHTWSRRHLLEQLLAQAMAVLADDPELRGSLAIGVDVAEASSLSDDLELVRDRLLHAVTQVGDSDVSRRLAEIARTTQRAAPVHPLAQLAAADSLTDETELRLRSHLAASAMQRAGGAVLVRSRAGELELTEDEWTRARGLFQGERASATGLRAALARKLLIAGVAVASLVPKQ